MNHMEKIWVCGASRRMGRKMIGEPEKTGAEVLLTDMDSVDVTDSKDVMDYARISRPHYIANCVGMTNVAACEGQVELAYRINALGARNLSVAARKIKARMVQLSTDDVFDGSSKVPYMEFDTPNPQTVYGKSKLAEENSVREFCNRHVTVRSPWILGDGNSYMQEILSVTKEGKEISATRDQMVSPTGAVELAGKVIEPMEHADDGLYHVIGQGHCSRYEFAKEVICLSGYDAEVRPVGADEDKLTLMRPPYSVPDNFMFRIFDIELLPSWKDMLERCMAGRRER